MSIKVNDVYEATHWIPRNIRNAKVESLLTIGKEYKLHYSILHEEHYIIDDAGMNSVYFSNPSIIGDFIKK